LTSSSQLNESGDLTCISENSVKDVDFFKTKEDNINKHTTTEETSLI
jgi:hypothetical protein